LVAGSDTKLHITWPDGRAAVVAIPNDDGAEDIVLSQNEFSV
tara:strand:- start:375 stop:500 length:126 start_codon:yes stop_codon:yes gene_type:complete